MLFNYVITWKDNKNIICFKFNKSKPSKSLVNEINNFLKKNVKNEISNQELIMVVEQFCNTEWIDDYVDLPMNEYSIFSFIWWEQNEDFTEIYPNLYEAIEDYISKWQKELDLLMINRSKYLDDEKPFTSDIFQKFKFKSNDLQFLLWQFENWRLWKVFLEAWIFDKDIKSKYWRKTVFKKIHEFLINTYSERVTDCNDIYLKLNVKNKKELYFLFDTINSVLMINWFRNWVFSISWEKNYIEIKF